MHCLCDFDILIWLILVGVISCRIRCVDFWFKGCWIGECFLFVRLREQSFSFFEGECVRVVSQTVLFLSLFLFLFLLLLLCAVIVSLLAITECPSYVEGQSNEAGPAMSRSPRIWEPKVVGVGAETGHGST